MMGVFSCVKWATKIKSMNQLEIAQNEIWTQRKISRCTVVCCPLFQV